MRDIPKMSDAIKQVQEQSKEKINIGILPIEEQISIIYRTFLDQLQPLSDWQIGAIRKNSTFNEADFSSLRFPRTPLGFIFACQLLNDKLENCDLSITKAFIKDPENGFWLLNLPEKFASTEILAPIYDTEKKLICGLRVWKSSRDINPIIVPSQNGLGDDAGNNFLSSTSIDESAQIMLPQLSSGALYGLAGDFVKVVLPYTEAHEAALLFQFLTAFGNAAGKSAYMVTDGAKQFLNLFLLLIGKTGKQGRKGTALGHVLNLFEAAVPDWAHKRILTGLASGQGLIHAVRDVKFKTDKNGNYIIKAGEEICLDVGEADKRLLCVEEEFGAVLKMQGIENSTLSATLRCAWDGKPLGNLSRQNSERCLNPHISLIGHITPDEFRMLLNDVELSNGYLNRFNLAYVWRSKILPEGGTMPQTQLNELIQRTREALEFAGNIQEIKRDESAKELWKDAYQKFNEQISIGLIGDVLSRVEAQVTRFSMLFAVLDHSSEIRREHLEAALELWKYCEDSAAFFFRGRIGDKKADKILQELRVHPEGLAQSRLYELFDRHITKAVLESKLIMLQEAGLIRHELREAETKKITVWFAVNGKS